VTVTIRNAAAGDILPIKRILSQYILETELVEDNLDQFIVAEEGSRIVGCACLDITPGVVEIRSIAVFPGWKRRGIGSKLYKTLKSRAEMLTNTLFVRTTSRGFFEKLGFEALDDSQKPEIWHDCAQCDKIDVCLQVPMMLELGSC
jgi:amino-acid N-acetyltransferase